MKVKLIAYTPDPEKVVAAAAKLCYSNADSIDDLMDGLTPENTSKFIRRLVVNHHFSPFEHASFTFAIEGISRVTMSQATRHRIASFSVQSQRYVSMNNFDVVIPDAIKDSFETKKVFTDAIEDQKEKYEWLRDALIYKYKSQGMDQTAAEKKANEDSRYILPNAATTRMIVTMNARSLMNFFNLRCCSRAQWEIRELAEEMFKLVYRVSPNLFSNAGPNCVSEGICPEGSMSCGKQEEMRNKYAGIKDNFAKTNLCGSCEHCFGECNSKSIIFGTGVGNDNVVECSAFTRKCE